MPKPLPDRIRAALINKTARLPDLRSVLAETIEAQAAADAAHAAAERRLVDPMADAAEIAAARADADKHRLDASRLARAIEALEETLAGREKAMQADAARQEHQEAKAERDALAADLTARVPTLLNELIGLFTRIEASDARLKAINDRRLPGVPSLTSAEAIARGCQPNFYLASGFTMGGGTPVTRLTSMVLPDFYCGQNIWPCPKMGQRMAANLEASMRQAFITAREPVSTEEAAEEKGTPHLVSQVPYPGFMRTGIRHRGGLSGVANEPVRLWMSAEEVEAARASGLTVEPAPELETETAEAAE